MGKAARWLRGLLGGKKRAAAGGSVTKPTKGKWGWGFAGSFRDTDPQRGEVVAGGASVAVDEVRKRASYREAGSRSYASSLVSSREAAPFVDDEDEQNKRVIAVAAATAAAADAAMAAVQAASAVVRLTSNGRWPAFYGADWKREEWAAIKIQAAFRGYLARRALRALRGLVKLQALVRGHIVRKQAAETLRCMQALVRVQARARACRALSENRRGGEGLRQTHLGPPTPQKCEHSNRANYATHDRGSNVKRNVSGSGSGTVDSIDPDRSQSWKWLDRWMDERCWDSREASWRAGAATADEKNDKILEIDSGKPHWGYRRRPNHSCSTLTSALNSRSFAAVLDSPSKDSAAQFSIPSASSTDMQQPLSPLQFALEEGKACDSPQLQSSSSRPGSAPPGSFTPTKSECARNLCSGYSDYRSYMANTESSRAKLRSQSAPKPRPDYERAGSMRRVQVVGAGCGHLLSSPSQKSASLHLKFTSKAYPGSGRLNRLEMPIRNY